MKCTRTRGRFAFAQRRAPTSNPQAMAFTKTGASPNTLNNPRGGTAAQNAANLINPSPTVVAQGNIPTIGNVSPIQNYQGQIPYSSIFTVELANASSGT